MKKIYSTLFFFFALSALSLFSFDVHAQCSGAIQNIDFDNGTCAVLGLHLPANTNVALLDNNAVLIGSGATNENGDVTVPYPCALTPYRLTACYTLPGGGTECCDAYVPAKIILPVKLTEFNAQLLSNQTVKLSWVSEMELSSYKYVVQRSTDGKNFSDI